MQSHKALLIRYLKRRYPPSNPLFRYESALRFELF